MANQRGFIAFAKKQIELAKRLERDLVVLLVRPQHVERDGPWPPCSADEDSRRTLELADILKHVFRGSDIIGRLDSDLFAIAAILTGKASPGILADRVRERAYGQNPSKTQDVRLTLEFGQAVCSPRVVQIREGTA